MRAETFKLASVLLQYPTTALFDGLDTLDAFVGDTGPKPTRESFARFLGWLHASAPSKVAQHYVDTFDLHRRCTLYLTYYRYGDTRKRGMAMVIFKTAYRDAGFVPCDDELPDYLPMVLDFAALCPRGQRLLSAHRTDLELLRRNLSRVSSPYADVVAGIIADLPGLGKRELDQVRTSWRSGPPREDVGLEPFAPPGYLAGYGPEREP